MESDQQEKEDGLTDKHRSSDLQICLAMKILICGTLYIGLYSYYLRKKSVNILAPFYNLYFKTPFLNTHFHLRVTIKIFFYVNTIFLTHISSKNHYSKFYFTKLIIVKQEISSCCTCHQP